MLPKYKGSVSINEHEIRNRPDHFYESIGVDFEFPSFYEKFTALENLKFFGSLYDCKLIPAEQLLEMVGLSQHANKKSGRFFQRYEIQIKLCPVNHSSAQSVIFG